MMNLKSLSDEALLRKLESLVDEERRVQTQVLLHLKEVERRRLHLRAGCGSLFDYAVRVLRYSEPAAARRISAMRLLKDLPEVEEKIQSGEVSLSNAAALQGFLKREEKEAGKTYSQEAKRELLGRLENKSRKECDQLLAALSPEARPKDRERVISEEYTEVRFAASKDLLQKLEKIRSLVSHRLPDSSYGELLEYLADEVLQRIDPEKIEERVQNRRAKKSTTSTELKPVKETTPPVQVNPRFIPAALRRQVWLRDMGRCQHRDPRTGRRCGSQRFLQLDHKIPVALDGKASPDNLELVCGQHNRERAREVLGEVTIQRFLED